MHRSTIEEIQHVSRGCCKVLPTWGCHAASCCCAACMRPCDTAGGGGEKAVPPCALPSSGAMLLGATPPFAATDRLPWLPRDQEAPLALCCRQPCSCAGLCGTRTAHVSGCTDRQRQ